MAPVLCKIVGAQATLSFEMYPLYTVGEVKQEITSRTNVSRNHLTLRGSHYLERLDDHVTLEECGYRGEATIHLGVRRSPGNPGFDLVVGLPNNNGWKPVRVRETTTVAELKDKIMQRWGIPADKMTLIRLSTVMEDSYCLLDYLISKLGDVRVEINDGCKGFEESNSEGYSTTT
ncbi:hypothetical protein OIU76_020840 [Salix suchowensis]|nr:hypothetical protein OIU76_020840 [Salix suchowensis]